MAKLIMTSIDANFRFKKILTLCVEYDKVLGNTLNVVGLQ
jgi:hypothetical protein